LAKHWHQIGKILAQRFAKHRPQIGKTLIGKTLASNWRNIGLKLANFAKIKSACFDLVALNSGVSFFPRFDAAGSNFIQMSGVGLQRNLLPEVGVPAAVLVPRRLLHVHLVVGRQLSSGLE